MSNSSANTEFVDTLTDVFLTWIQQDILPLCVATLDIIIILLGTILNMVLVVTFKQKGLMNEASTFLVLLLAIVDFIAYASVLLPTVIASIAGEWLLSDPVCQFHGAMVAWMMLANFTFLSVLAVERGLKICKPDRHDSVFEVRKYVYVITGLLWILSGILAFLPVIGVADIKYDFFHQGCTLDYESSPGFLLVHFHITVVSSLVIFTVSYGYIFNVRRHALNANRTEAFTQRPHPSRRNQLSGIDNGLPVIDEEEERTDNNTAFVKAPSGLKGQSKPPVRGKGRRRKRPEPTTGIAKVFEIFSDDQENPAFHLSITYVSLWACILVCYLPYYVVAFYGTFNEGGLWRGFYTITLLISHVSFVVKPFIYLGHNRHYRSVTKETVPEAVMNKARSVRNSITGIGDKLEDLVFRSPQANKGFGNVIATHKAILIWKTKMKIKQDQLKNRSGVVKTITNTPVEAESSLSSKQGDEGNHLDKKVNFQGNDNIRSQPTTPSGIQIATSSYIENERQKLLASMKSFNSTPHKDTNPSSPYSPVIPSASPPLMTPTSDDELPGMIGGNDVRSNGSHSISPIYGSQNDQLRLI